MDTVYFLARYTPFWSLPIMFLAAEFTYLFWVRKKKKMVMICSMFFICSVLATTFYWYLGGPEKTVKFLMNIVHFYTL